MPSGPEGLSSPAPRQIIGRVRGGRLDLARAAFLLLAGVCVGLLLLFVPISLRTIQMSWQFQTTYPVVARFFSRSGYGVYMLTFSYLVALMCVLVGVVIAWRKADDRVAWLAGAMLVTLPVFFGPGGESGAWAYYRWPWRSTFALTHDVLSLAGLQMIVLFVFVFPDGRLPLRWMRWALGAFMAATSALAALLLAAGAVDFYIPTVITFVTIMLLGLAGQFYRYRRLSTPLGRQQTKWVVVGLALLITGFLVSVALQAATTATPAEGVVLLAMNHVQGLSLALLPVTLAFSVLRYRLWDIDRLIRRTLLYAVLTGALAGLYLGSVIVLQSVLRAATGQAQSPVVTVLSTLLIAATAGPLRVRVQGGMDRRFNRRRYDAARTLEAFGADLRGDAYADLDRLNDQLIGVVQDTLEPEKVSLWLRS